MDEHLKMLRAILTLVPNVDSIVTGLAAALIDARSDTVRVLGLAPRPWARFGVREVELCKNGLSSQVVRDLKTRNLPIFILTNYESRDRDVEREVVLRAIGELRATAVFVCSDGSLIRGSDEKPVEWSPRHFVDCSESTHIYLKGRRFTQRLRENLPLEIEVNITGEDRDRRFIGIEVKNDYSTDMPEPVWYRLSGPNSGILSIDIEALPHGDRFDISYAGDNNNLSLLRGPIQRAPHSSDPLRDLAVIFDRTCPDRAAWSQALAVAAGSISWLASTATGGDDLWGDESRDSGRLNGPDFNKVIRTALGDALAGVLEGQSTRVKAWWFADTAGEGIETPDGVELPLHTYGSVDAAILHQAFRECTYSPGLDLWDPVEDALGEALEYLRENRAGRSAVLIVGNSPPNVPVNDPIKRLIESATGFRTSVRRPFSDFWQILMEQARDLNIRVVYLFLRHSLADNADTITATLQEDHLRYTKLSMKVREGLASYLTVVEAEADAEGVADGVRRALEAINEPESSESCVEVENT